MEGLGFIHAMIVHTRMKGMVNNGSTWNLDKFQKLWCIKKITKGSKQYDIYIFKRKVIVSVVYESKDVHGHDHYPQNSGCICRWREKGWRVGLRLFLQCLTVKEKI